ncbi:MAG TPA: UvrB/UvrC motif-containing protein [Verrucomicrobiae bacterium]|nr:UvrB/UvrC motif-containing protein [Verrucomicrobiae bacterium]
MNFDISHLLDQWEYQAGQVVVRRFIGKDGQDKIQLRVDLGLLQMNAHGRPDGKRPCGHPSLFDYYITKLNQHMAEHDGDDGGFVLSTEDCNRLQMEALQYHHRYICLLQLEDYAGVVRDTSRNLKLFDFVAEHGDTDELVWTLLQFSPQVLMIHTRANASQSLQAEDFPGAIAQIEEGVQKLQAFYEERCRPDLLEQSAEIQSLQQWSGEIQSRRPLSRREQLETALHEAVKCEDYEKAAQMRDALRNLKPSDS